ncbi:MAG: DUF547 domain-containing protein [Parvularculaceae bacterium]
MKFITKAAHAVAGALASFVVFASTASAQDKLKVFDAFDADSAVVVDHGAWDAFLSAYVVTFDDGRTAVNYAGVTDTDKEALKEYVSALEAIDPTTLSRAEAFVYRVNLNTAVTVDVILDNYPLKSIRSIFSGFRPGPWGRKLIEVNGVDITLDNVEHGILRPFFDDNRVHYAVNCASIGCPNLLDSAFRAEGLDETLDAAAREYVNHPRGFRVDGDRVIASSIYNWFQEDFGGDEAGVIAHLKKFAEPELAETLSGVDDIDKYEYDWALNDSTQ